MRLSTKVLASIFFAFLAYGSPVLNASATPEELEAQGLKNKVNLGYKFITALKEQLKQKLPDNPTYDSTKSRAELETKLEEVSGIDLIDSLLEEYEDAISPLHQAACTAAVFETLEILNFGKITVLPPFPNVQPALEKTFTCFSSGAVYYALVAGRVIYAREMEVPDNSSGALLRNLHNLDMDNFSKEHDVEYFKHVKVFGYAPVSIPVADGVSVKIAVVPQRLMDIDPYVPQLESKGLYNTVGVYMWHSVTGEVASNYTDAQLEIIHHPKKMLISANTEPDTYTITTAPFQSLASIAKNAASLTPGKSSLSSLYSTRGLVSLTVRQRPVYFPEFDPDAIHEGPEEASAAAKAKQQIDDSLKEGSVVRRLGTAKLSDFCYTFADYATKSVYETEFRFGGLGEINDLCSSSLVTYNYDKATTSLQDVQEDMSN